MSRRHTDAGIRHAERHPVVPVVGAAGDGERDGAVFGELAGIAQQVEERLAELRDVRVHRPEVLGRFEDEVVALLEHERLDRRHRVAQHRGEVEALQVQLHLARFDLREVEHAVDEAEQGLPAFWIFPRSATNASWPESRASSASISL